MILGHTPRQHVLHGHGFEFELEHQHDIRNLADHCNITTNPKVNSILHGVESIEDDLEWNLHRPFCAKTRTVYGVICMASEGVAEKTIDVRDTSELYPSALLS